MLRLVLRDGQVTVSAMAPVQTPEPEPPAGEVRTARLRELAGALQRDLEALQEQVRPLAERKSALLQQTSAPGFYEDAAARAATFDEIHRLDQFLALVAGLATALQGVRERAERPAATPAEEEALRDRLEQLGAELDHLRGVAACRGAEELGDALVCLTLVHRRGTAQGGVEKLAGMYRGFARRRRLSVEVLGEYQDERQDRACLLVSGLGALASFRFEEGVHQIDHRYRRKNPRTGREEQGEDRETVRVEVFPAGTEPGAEFRRRVKVKTVALRPAVSRLVEKATLAVSLFHEPSLRSLDLWAAGPKADAVTRGLWVLQAQVARGGAAESAPGAEAIVRRYDLGTAARVKDLRTGRTTSRVDRVFKGELDGLCASAGPDASRSAAPGRRD